jgi:hypothetical protein
MRVATCTSAVLALLLTATAARAALTTESCLAQKQKLWGGLRKCQAGEKAKLLQSKPADLAKCQTKFNEKLGKISTKAADASVACRYGDNGDGTVTDYDTGLEWEQKTADLTVHDKDNTYSWNSFITSTGFGFLDLLNNCTTTNGTAVTTAGFAGHCDWRLPTIQELKTIVDVTAAGCASGSPCIDPIFGPTAANIYWSATTDNANAPTFAWFVHFFDGSAVFGGKSGANRVRAVRTGS